MQYEKKDKLKCIRALRERELEYRYADLLISKVVEIWSDMGYLYMYNFVLYVFYVNVDNSPLDPEVMA